MSRLTQTLSLTSLLFSGAIFGFFYAFVCSTMWGLDAIDPRMAIPAMQEINAAVRNPVFFPAFFLTPFILALTALSAAREGAGKAALAFGLATVTYALGGMILTMIVNVPMNEALGALSVPEDRAAAQEIWNAYSPRWQLFNTIRTVLSGAALLLAGIGLLALPRVADMPVTRRQTTPVNA